MGITRVINLYGGPGSGKSTLAAELFTLMKQHHLSVELVTEYAKGWAWSGTPIDEFSQFYILSKQFKQESRLYGKVDWIITDSPLLMCSVYECIQFRFDLCRVLMPQLISARNHIKVIDHNVYLERVFPYRKEGRYQTEQEAMEVDREILRQIGRVPYYHSKSGPDRAAAVIKSIEVELNEQLF